MTYEKPVPPPPAPPPKYTRPAPMPMYSEPQYRSDIASKQTKRENEGSSTSIDSVGQVVAQPIVPLEPKVAASEDSLIIAGQDWS